MASLANVIASYAIAAILFVVFLDAIFKINPWSVVTFVVSCGLAFYRGAILREPRLIAYIAIGNIIMNVLMSSLAPQIWNDLLQGSLISVGVLGLVFLIIYLHVREITDYPEKRGKFI